MMRKHFILVILLSCLHVVARGQTMISLDDIDLSGLPQPKQIKALHYWFDEDAASMQTVSETSGIHFLEIVSLYEGIHTLHYQVVGSDGGNYDVASIMFLKIGDSIGDESVKASKIIYWFDDETVILQADISEGMQMLDVSKLMEGLHTIHYKVLYENGQTTSIKSSIFLRMSLAMEPTTAKSIRYWFDDDVNTVNVIDTANGTQALDVSALSRGLHTLNYQTVDSKGNVGTPVARIFFKNFDKVIEGGQNRVTKYQYWLNTNSQSMQTVELACADNPYTLITLLPMQKEPIHSDCFHFEVTNDVPTIYAKNILHVRFHDAQGYFTDGEKPFVDYSVKQEVTDIEPLVSGVRSTITKPTENTIKWYRLEAERGDSLSFKLDRAANVQLFAPSGEELFSVMGIEATNWFGCHVEENGTFYVALHDVTAQQGSTISINYEHIDKYALLSYTPNNLGVLPCGQVILLKGNGFDKMIAAALSHGNQLIMAKEIYPDGKTEAELFFELQGDEERGMYDLVVTFEDEGVEIELIVSEAISLSAPDFSDFKIDISDPRSVANPYPVSISITNNGNLTYSDIPFFIAYDNVEKINEMLFLNFEVEADTSLVNGGLKFVYDIEDFKGKGIRAKMIPTMIPLLRPGETTTIKLGFRASNHATYNVYAWAGTPWSLYAWETMSAIQSIASGSSGGSSGGAGSGDSSGGSGSGDSSGGSESGGSSGGSGSGDSSGGSGSGDSSGGSGSGGSSGGSGGSSSGGAFSVVLPGGYGGGGGAGGYGSGSVGVSCMPDPCDIAGLLGDIQECLCGTGMGLIGVFSGIDLALINRHYKAHNAQLAESGLYDSDDFMPLVKLPHPGDILRKWAEHCLPGKAGQAASALNSQMDMMGFDPCPNPTPHPCNQYNPGDPNDIFGYMAE